MINIERDQFPFAQVNTQTEIAIVIGQGMLNCACAGHGLDDCTFNATIRINQRYCSFELNHFALPEKEAWATLGRES